MEKALGAPPSPSSAPIRQIQEPLKSPVRQRTRRWSTIAPIPEDSRAEVDQGPYSPRDQHHVDRVEDLNSASSSQSELDVLKKMTPITEDPPYHVFTLTQKRRLVYIVSLAALFSPLSSNIYFPALGAIATVRVQFLRLSTCCEFFDRPPEHMNSNHEGTLADHDRISKSAQAWPILQLRHT